MRPWLALLVLCAVTRAAYAQLELRNDGFDTGDAAAFQGGFVVGEFGASRFVAPEAGRTLQKVIFLFGGAAGQRNVIVRVWDDTAGTDIPGAELLDAEFQLTASDSAFQSVDLAGMNVVVPAQFRVGIGFLSAGLPSIARDSDGDIMATRNFIYADLAGSLLWFKSMDLGLTGDWILRAEISSGGGGGASDAGVSIDAGGGGGGGGACAGNAQCQMGEYCNLDQMVCTFDCRTADDCGGGTCNSLGQCIGTGGDEGGCGCQARPGGSPAGLVLAALVLLVLVRRR